MTIAPSIDVHSHFYPRAFLDLIKKQGNRYSVRCSFEDPAGPVIEMNGHRLLPLDERYFDLEARLRSMNDQGVDMHALSLTIPMVYWAPRDLSRQLSEVFNDACMEAHEQFPDRFVGLAMLPMQEPSLAIAELGRVENHPAIRGVYMATRIGERELSDPDFFDVYERIEDLGLTIFLHPVTVVDPDRLKRFYLTNFIGNPTESAIAASHLIFGEVLDRFPKLSICLPHAGGSFPFLIGRISHGWSVRQECQHLERSPSEYLRRFHFDTITHSPSALEYLLQLVGADRVVMGSDFCFDMSYEQPVKIVIEHPSLDDEKRALILGENARRLLQLDKR